MLLLLSTQVIVGCQHMERIDIAQITYELLRAEDCRRNQLEDFCSRTYAADYHDYVRMRRDFIRYQGRATQTGKQAEIQSETPNKLTLHKVLNNQ